MSAMINPFDITATIVLMLIALLAAAASISAKVKSAAAALNKNALADAVGLVEKIVAVAQLNGRQPWKR